MDKTRAREIMESLSGMVAEPDNGRLVFREAAPDERPLNHGARRQIARYYAAGLDDHQVLEVIGSW